MSSASEQWLFNITWVRSPSFRDVLPVDRRMSFMSNVESPQEWSLLRIMRSCRIPVTEALAGAIDRTITLSSNTDWNNFVSFPILALGVPISPSNAGSSLSSVIRANLKQLTQSPFDTSTLCQQLPCHQDRRESSPSEKLRSLINTKQMLSDVKADMRVVSSDDNVLEVTTVVPPRGPLGTNA